MYIVCITALNVLLKLLLCFPFCSLRILFKLKSKLKLNKRFEVTPPPYAEATFSMIVFLLLFLLLLNAN